MTTVTKAIKAINPNAKVTVNGDNDVDNAKIEWLGGTSEISKSDIKTKMAELADAFIALPGGAGTLEEIFEQWTWSQLGIHQKPCAFLNIDGFYDGVIQTIQDSVNRGFSQARFVEKLIVADNIGDILKAFTAYEPAIPKWMSTAEIQA